MKKDSKRVLRRKFEEQLGAAVMRLGNAEVIAEHLRDELNASQLRTIRRVAQTIHQKVLIEK